MERTDRRFTILIGLALLLVGLLSGILAMLVFDDTDPAPVIVERSSTEERPELLPEPDSTLPSIPIELASLNKMFKDVAKRVTPGVVFIQVEVQGNEEGGGWFHLRGSRQSMGSGVIISRDGYVVTNKHVVEDAVRIQVTMDDKAEYPAEIVGLDPSTDLAVIKIEGASNLPTVRLGNSDAVEVGEWVLAVGNPFRLTSTVTAGIVSALGRQVNIIQDQTGIENFIQTDAAINPGNSGGALVNLRGELVGINTAIATETGSYEGYGFAVPVNLMERIVTDLIAYGEVQRGFLGISIVDVNAAIAEDLGLDRVGGVYISQVHNGGAADQAGLQSGDVVLAIEGTTVDASNSLQSTVANFRPGDKIEVEVWRNLQRRLFKVELFGRDNPAYAGWLNRRTAVPEQQAPLPNLPETERVALDNWGLTLHPLTERIQRAFAIEEGAYVLSVTDGSLSDIAGLPRDVIILSIAGQDIASAEDAVEMLEDVAQVEESVLMRVKRRDGVTAFYEIEVPPTE